MTGPLVTPEHVQTVMRAVDAYRTNQPILAETLLAQLGVHALPTAMFLLIGAMDAVDLRAVYADEVTIDEVTIDEVTVDGDGLD